MTAFDHRPGVQPNATEDEWHEADVVLRAHPDIVAALALRGITDLDLVLFDTWTYGFALDPRAVPGPPGRLGRRLVPGRSRRATRTRTRSTGCTRSST